MIVFSASVFCTVWSFLADLAYSLCALLVRQITCVPIKFAGTSEKIDGLEAFDAERYADRILGIGDIVALVEQVTANIHV